MQRIGVVSARGAQALTKANGTVIWLACLLEATAALDQNAAEGNTLHPLV